MPLALSKIRIVWDRTLDGLPNKIRLGPHHGRVAGVPVALGKDFLRRGAWQRQQELVWGAPNRSDIFPAMAEISLRVRARAKANDDLFGGQQPSPAVRIHKHRVGQLSAGAGPRLLHGLAKAVRLAELELLLLAGRFEDGEPARRLRYGDVAFRRLTYCGEDRR